MQKLILVLQNEKKRIIDEIKKKKDQVAWKLEKD